VLLHQVILKENPNAPPKTAEQRKLDQVRVCVHAVCVCVSSTSVCAQQRAAERAEQRKQRIAVRYALLLRL
jgi:hypothetical protein